jgi:hypothetical protein
VHNERALIYWKFEGIMSLMPVSFFMPIKYGHQLTSIREKITEFTDAYFHLTGQVAVVIPGKIFCASQGVELQPGKAIWWQSALKVISYTAYFFNLLITTQFPMIREYRRIVQLQMILSFLPIFIMIAKIILRLTFRFHIDSEPKGKESTYAGKPSTTEDNATKISKKEPLVAHILPTDLIPLQVKVTLDNLFGGPGSVDRLPVFEGDLNELGVGSMKAPIMKGKSNPFIVIKMRCLSSLEEVKRIYPFFSKKISMPIENIVILGPSYTDTPLMWEQWEEHGIAPEFFKRSVFHIGNFTYEENGKLTEGQTIAFELLKRVIKEGRGKDIDGLEWEIIR